MVLIIEGSLLHSLPCSTQELYSKYPSLREKGEAFASQSVQHIGNEGFVYTAQGEYAVVKGSDARVKYLGSDDATTCHIVVLRHPESGTSAVAHFDGRNGEDDALDAMINKIGKIEGEVQELELYVVGGYIPEPGSKEAQKNESEILSIKLINMFNKHECKLNVKIWCTCIANTCTSSKFSRPKVYGVGIEIATGLFFPAFFKYHDPDIALRNASRFMSSSGELKDLYDTVTGQIIVDPFTYGDTEVFGMYANLPNYVILENFSTSPKVEPPHFCDELRKTFQFLADHPDPEESLFPNNRSQVFEMDQRGRWKKV